MIKIEFSTAVALYLFLTVFIVFVIWLFFENRKIAKPLYSDNRFFWQCNICTYVYVDTMHNTISQCPRCGSYNNKEDSDKKGGVYA